MFSTDNLQAGDRVVVVISDTFSGIGKYIGTVIKKTPSGMVDVRCCGVMSRYKRDGDEYGKRDPYSRRRKYLIEATEEEQKKIALSITEFGENKKVGFDVSRINRGVLTEAQFISLIYVLGLGYRQDEIAYVLGCTKQTVNVHIQRALKRICRFLEKEDNKGEKNKKKRRRSSRQVAKRARSVLHKHEPGKGKDDKTSLPHSRSGSK